jgi:hypothetical protein
VLGGGRGPARTWNLGCLQVEGGERPLGRRRLAGPRTLLAGFVGVVGHGLFLKTRQMRGSARCLGYAQSASVRLGYHSPF